MYVCIFVYLLFYLYTHTQRGCSGEAAGLKKGGVKAAEVPILGA